MGFVGGPPDILNPKTVAERRCAKCELVAEKGQQNSTHMFLCQACGATTKALSSGLDSIPDAWGTLPDEEKVRFFSAVQGAEDHVLCLQ